jgi:endonuclease YncB( thermonuclease family)
VGKVYLDKLYINAEMVRTVYVWFYCKYGKYLRLYDLENEARIAQRGLWAYAQKVPPWEWRRIQREGKKN